MAGGNLVSDYIQFGAGAPGMPSLGNNATEAAVYLRTSNGHLLAWDGAAWIDTSTGGGGSSFNWRIVSATMTVLVNDTGILCDNSAASFVVNLPTCAGSTQLVAIKKFNDAGSIHTVTITPNGADTIEGGATLVLSANESSVLLQNDGSSKWAVAAASGPEGICSDPTLGFFSNDPVPSPKTLHDDLRNIANRLAVGERQTVRWSFSQLAFNDSYATGFDATGGDLTCTLNDSPDANGRYLFVFKIDNSANTVTIVDGGGALINGQANYVLTTQNQGVLLAGDGNGNWLIVAKTGLAVDLPTFIASGVGHAPGAVPDPGSMAGTSKFLREDATWVNPAAAGPGAIIAQTAYGPDTHYLVAGAAAVMTAIDTTNLRLAIGGGFGGGSLLIEIELMVSFATNGLWLGLLEGGTTVAERVIVTAPITGVVQCRFLMTGLAAGAHNYDLAYRVSGGDTLDLFASPVDGGAHDWGQAMIVARLAI
jgi:hypothetical protein